MCGITRTEKFRLFHMLSRAIDFPLIAYQRFSLLSLILIPLISHDETSIVMSILFIFFQLLRYLFYFSQFCDLCCNILRKLVFHILVINIIFSYILHSRFISFFSRRFRHLDTMVRLKTGGTGSRRGSSNGCSPDPSPSASPSRGRSPNGRT